MTDAFSALLESFRSSLGVYRSRSMCVAIGRGWKHAMILFGMRSYPCHATYALYEIIAAYGLVNSGKSPRPVRA